MPQEINTHASFRRRVYFWRQCEFQRLEYKVLFVYTKVDVEINMDGGGYSILNQAGSINFEIPAGVSLCRQDAAEEDEAEQDECQKKKELQDLLENAFDDLIDGDEDVDTTSDERSNNETRNFDGCSDVERDASTHNEPLERVNYEGPRHVTPQLRNPMILDKGGQGEGHLYQLQILYSVRGRELVRLQQELESIQDHTTKETHLLKHNLDVVMAEKEGMARRLDDLESELMNVDSEKSGLQGQINAQAYQIKSLAESKDEMQSKLHMAESTIENLQHEIKEMTRSESISRARQQHAAFVKNLQERHKIETFELQQQVDNFQEALNEKTNEIISLRKDLGQAVRDMDALRMEKAETVNRLTRALDESQKLLNSGSAQETRDLQAKLKQVEESKTHSNELTASLQEEIKSLKTELDLYLRNNPPNFKNGPRKDAASTSVQNEHLLHNLKEELERSLSLLCKKKHQISQLQEELQLAQKQVADLKKWEKEASVKLEAAEKLRKDAADMAQEIVSLREIKGNLATKSKNMEMKLTEAESKEAAMMEKLRLLEEKYEEVRRNAACDTQTACLNIAETAMQTAKKEIGCELEQCHLQYQSQIHRLVDEMNHVKTLYVDICKEKDDSENKYEMLCTKYEREIQEWDSIQRGKFEMLKAEYEKRLSSAVSQARAETAQAAEEKSSRLTEQLEKDHLLRMQEQTLSQIKEKLENVLGNHGKDSSEQKLDDYLQQMKVFQNRLKETEDHWRQKLLDVEKNAQVARRKEIGEMKEKLAEKEVALDRLRTEYSNISDNHIKDKENSLTVMKERMTAEKGMEMKTLAEKMKQAMEDVNKEKELSFQKYVHQLLHAAELSKLKALEEISLTKERELQQKLCEVVSKAEKDKAQVIKTLEESLGSELAKFLDEQRRQFVGALENLKGRHEREKNEMERKYSLQYNAIKERIQTFTPDSQPSSKATESDPTRKLAEELQLMSAFSQLKELLDQLSTDQKLHLERKLQETRDEENAVLKEQLLHAGIKLEQIKNDYKAEVQSHQVTLSKYNALKEKARKHNRRVQAKECQSNANFPANVRTDLPHAYESATVQHFPSRTSNQKPSDVTSAPSSITGNIIQRAHSHQRSAPEAGYPARRHVASDGLDSYKEFDLNYHRPEKLHTATAQDGAGQYSDTHSAQIQSLSQELKSLKESFIKSLSLMMPTVHTQSGNSVIIDSGHRDQFNTGLPTSRDQRPLGADRRCSGSDN